MRAPFQNNHRIWPSTNSVMEAWAKSNSQFDRNWWMYGRALLGCFLQIHLPINQTCRYGTPMLHLCPSECIFLICVPFLFDWCMIQVKQLVRKDQIVKKDNTCWPDRLTYQSTQNGNNGKPSHIYSHPTAFSLSTINSGSIGVWIKWNIWWEGIEFEKRTTTEDHTETLTFPPKTALRNAPARIYNPPPIACSVLSGIIPVWLMYDKSKTICQKAWKLKKCISLHFQHHLVEVVATSSTPSLLLSSSHNHSSQDHHQHRRG